MKTSPSIRYLVATPTGFLQTTKAGNHSNRVDVVVPSYLEATEYTSLSAVQRAVKSWKEKNWQLTALELSVRILIPSDVTVK